MGTRPIQWCARVRIERREAIETGTRAPFTRNSSHKHPLPPIVEALVRLDSYQIAAISDSDVRHNPTEKKQVSDYRRIGPQMVQRGAPT
jgi:hypothetical protein